jgi:TP901 family phage tail tape measure protein
MADQKYTIIITVDGKQVQPEASKLRKALEAELGVIQVKGGVEIAGLERSAALMKEMRVDAGALGRAIGSGLGRQWGALEGQLSTLQQKITGLIEHGKKIDLTKEIVDNAPEMEAALTIGTKKALEQSLAIREVNASLTELYKTRATLRTTPVQTMGEGETRQLGELMRFFGESRHMRNKIKRFTQDVETELRPLQKAVDREIGAARTAAEKQLAGLLSEMSDVTVRMQAMEEKRPSLGGAIMKPAAAAEWEEDFATLARQHRQLEDEISRHRSAAMGAGGGEKIAQLNLRRRELLKALADETPFWREAVLTPEELSMQWRQGMQKEAAQAFEELSALEKEISRQEGLLKRRTGALMKGGEAALPQSAEGTMVDFVRAERALEMAAAGATDELDRQFRIMGKLITRLDDGRLALEGLTKAQRVAVQRVEATAQREIRTATTAKRAPTVEAAGAASRKVLSRLAVEVKQTVSAMDAALAQDVTESQTKQTNKILKTWNWLRVRLVGRSIIPDMVEDINRWLASIGSQERFDEVAGEGEDAARRLIVAFQRTAESLPLPTIEAQIAHLTQDIHAMSSEFEGLMVKGKEQSRRYKAQFEEAVESARRLRGPSEEDEAMFAQGYLPKGFSVAGSGEAQWQKSKGRAERLAKGITEDTNDWYRALNNDLEERKRWTAEETQKMDSLAQRMTSRQAQLSALQVTQATKLADSYANAVGAATSTEDAERIFTLLDRASDDFQAANNQLETDIVMVASLAEQAKRDAEKEKAPRARQVRAGLTADEQARLAQIKTAGQMEIQQAKAVQVKVVETERRKTAIVKGEMKRRAASGVLARKQELAQVKTTGQVTVQEARAVQVQVTETEKRKTAALRGELQERSRLAKAQQAEQRKLAAAQQAAAEAGVAWPDVVRWQEQAGASVDQVAGALKRTTVETRRLGAESRRLAQVQEKNVGLAGRFVKNLQEARTASQGVMMVAQDIQNLGRTMQFTGTAIVGSMTLAGRSYLELAAQSDMAARSLGLNQEMTQALRDEIVALASDMALIDPQQTAKGVTVWAQATGQEVANLQDLQGVLKQTEPLMKLSALSQSNLAANTDGTAAALRQYKLELSETGRVVAVFNMVADDTLAEVADITEAFKHVGPQAHAMGMSLEDSAALMGQWADQGIKGGQAGRAFRQALLSLSEMTDETKEKMQETFGTESPFYDAQGQFVGFAEVVDRLAWATEKMTDAQRDELVAMMFTSNVIPAITASIGEQTKARERDFNSLRARTKLIEGTIDDEVRAYAAMRQEIDGVSTTMVGALELWDQQWSHYEQSDVQRVKQAEMRWKAMWLTIGQQGLQLALPYLETASELITDMTSWIQANPWIAQIGALIGAGAITVGTTLTIFSTAMKGVMTLRTLVATVQGTLSQQHGTAAHFNTQVTTAAETFRAIIVGAAEQAAGVEQAGAQAEVATEQAGAEAETATEIAGAQTESGIEIASAIKASGLVLAAFVGIAWAADKFADSVREGHEQVDDAWGGWLSAQERERDSALALAQEYNKAQQDVRGKMWGGGPLKDVLMTAVGDDARILNANTQALLQSMARSSSSYSDMVQGIEEVNSQLGEYERRLALVTTAEYEELKTPAGGGRGGTLDQWLQSTQKMADDALAELGSETYGAAQRAAGQIYQGAEIMAGLKPLAEEEKRAVDLYLEYLGKLADETESYGDRLGDLAADLAKDLKKLDADYYRDANKERRDFNESQTEQETKRNLDREKRARDHAIKMQQMEQDHALRVIDLVGKRDALGLVKEDRAYELKRSRAEADFARSEGDTAVNFKREQEKRAIEFERRQEEKQTEWQAERIARQEEYEEQKTAAFQEHQETLARLKSDYFDKLNAELEYYKQSQEQQLAYNRAMLIDAGTFLARNRDLWLEHLRNLPAPSPGAQAVAAAGGTGGGHAPPPGVERRQTVPRGRRAGGGYAASAGQYQLAERGREYVMNAPTTKMAERAFGALSQGKLAQSFRGGGGSVIYFSQQNVYHDVQDAQDVALQVRRETYQAMLDVAEKLT